MVLSDTAQKIFTRKYAKENETWEQACTRVASYVSQEDSEYVAKYFQLIYERVFIPGGRILANSGTTNKNLMNCFVLPVEDSRDSIFTTAKDAAEVLAQGGGVGYNFEKLREKGSKVGKQGNKSSGPISFMELFDSIASIIKITSRRGAQMGMLNINHPDIEKFINAKGNLAKVNRLLEDEFKYKSRHLKDANFLIEELGYEVENSKHGKYISVLKEVLLGNQLSNFNISVVITDDFMEAVKEDKNWELISPLTNESVKTVKARELFNLLAEQAWNSGDPGVFFYDRVNKDNMIPSVNNIIATNPCGEVPLMPYESCCLGSLNLSKFHDSQTGIIDYEFLEYAVRIAVRFLDDVVEVSESPIENINNMSKKYRRIGLGVMGWADLLAKIGLPYDSKEAKELARYLSWFISFFAWLESFSLGEEKGVYFTPDNTDVIDNVLNSEYVGEGVLFNKPCPRNISVTSIAPTGSIALISEVNSSIEPFFSLYYTRGLMSPEGGNIAEDTITEINSILFDKLESLDYSEEEIIEIKNYVREYGTLKDCPLIPEELCAVFKTSHEIDWLDHIKMQEAWQEFVSNAVSKTINMSNQSTIDQVRNAFMEMWERGLKGGTIYRDGSKAFQVLSNK